MPTKELDLRVRGWWRIVETSQWNDRTLDALGSALLSVTGYADRLRMHFLIADLTLRATKTGASFTWEGAWEFDPMSGTGSVRLGRDGKLRGTIKFKDGDTSTFVAVKTEEPTEPIPSPPSYRDKWRRRRWRR